MMSNSYAVISALIFAIVATMHLVRIINRWSVVIGLDVTAITCDRIFGSLRAVLECWARRFGLVAISITAEPANPSGTRADL